MRVGLSEDHLHISRVLLLKLLLQVAAAMLIFAKRVNFVNQALKLNIGESVDFSVVGPLLHISCLHPVGLLHGLVDLLGLAINGIAAIGSGMEDRGIHVDVPITSV